LENEYVNIGYKTYIPINNIEIITDFYNIKDFRIKKKELSLREKYINVSMNNKTQSCILTEDPTLFRSYLTSKTIVKRAGEEHFLRVGSTESSYINRDKIEFIIDYDNRPATIQQLINERKYENKVYNLSKKNKSRSIIVVKQTGNIYISPVRAETLVER
jgi:regulator of extracellular matrix RemA (YlzA/DUF370 family)